MLDSTTKFEVGFTLGCLLLAMIVNAIVGAYAWPYTINTWLVFFGKEPVIVWWQGALIGFVPYIGNATIPAALCTFILMLFLT